MGFSHFHVIWDKHICTVMDFIFLIRSGDQDSRKVRVASTLTWLAPHRSP